MSREREITINSLSAIEHILEHKPKRIRMIKVPVKAEGRVAEVAQIAKRAGIPLDPSLGKGEEIIAQLHAFEYAELSETIARLKNKKKAFILALDHLQDPQNLGALCRSAEGLGLDAVLLPKDRSVSVNAGAYHASVGAVETLPVVHVVNLGDALRKLKNEGFWIVGSTLGEDSQPPDAVPDFEKMVLVLGSELEGMSSSLQKQCDWQVMIPLSGRVQSLNVSAAGAILMYELLRRQRAGK